METEFEKLVASYEKLPLIGGIAAVRSYLKRFAKEFGSFRRCMNCVYSRANQETITAPPFSGGLDVFDRTCSLGLEKDACGKHTPIV